MLIMLIEKQCNLNRKESETQNICVSVTYKMCIIDSYTHFSYVIDRYTICL